MKSTVAESFIPSLDDINAEDLGNAFNDSLSDDLGRATGHAGKTVAKTIIIALAVDLAKEIAKSQEAKELVIDAVRFIVSTIAAATRPIGRMLKKWVDKLRKNGREEPNWAVDMFPENEEEIKQLPSAAEEVEEVMTADAHLTASKKMGKNPKVKKIAKSMRVQGLAKKFLAAMLKTGLSLDELLLLVEKAMKSQAVPKGFRWKKKQGRTFLVPSSEKALELKDAMEDILRKAGVDYIRQGSFILKWETKDYYVTMTFSGKGCSLELYDGGPSEKPVMKERFNSEKTLRKHVGNSQLLS